MPGSFQACIGPGIPGVPVAAPFSMPVTIQEQATQQIFRIAGVTRNASGVALGNCAVVLLRSADNSVAALVTSDASGIYSIPSSSAIQHRADAYLAGSPDVVGSTVNTLVGT